MQFPVFIADRLPQLAMIERYSIEPEGRFSTDAAPVKIGGLVIVATDVSVEARDAGTGKRMWRYPSKSQIGVAIAGDSTDLYISLDREFLLDLDPKSGKVKWKIRRSGYASEIVFDAQRVYAQLAIGQMSAIERRTHRVLWTVPLPTLPNDENPALVGHPSVANGRLILSTRAGTMLGLSLQDGKKRWEATVRGDSVRVVAVDGAGFFQDRGRLGSFDPATGMLRWEKPLPEYSQLQLTPLGGGIIAAGADGWVKRYDGAGKLLAQARLYDADDMAPGPFVSDGTQLWAYTGGLLVRTDLNLKHPGVVRMGSSRRGSVLPLGGNQCLLFDGSELKRMQPGSISVPGDRAARLAIARKIAGHAELNSKDRRTLKQLGSEGVTALVERGLRTKTADGYLLMEIAKPADTSEMMRLIKAGTRLGDTGWVDGEFESWLRYRGVPGPVVDYYGPIFGNTSQKEEQRARALSAIAGLKDPRAVRIVRNVLTDAKSSEGFLEIAYARAAACEDPEVLDLLDKIRAASPVALAGRAPETDEEQVMAAAFEVRFRFDSRTSKPGLFSFPEGAQPFQLTGWKGGLKIGKFAGGTRGRNYENPILRFSPPANDPEGLRLPYEASTTVVFNAARTEATVMVGATYGGLDGTGYTFLLKKLRGKWYVVDMKMSWIS